MRRRQLNQSTLKGNQDLETTQPGPFNPLLTAIRTETTRKPTAPGKDGRPRADFSNLDNVYELIQLVRDSIDKIKADLKQGSFPSGDKDPKYRRIFNSLYWKKCQLWRQADILERLEHPLHQRHSAAYPDLLELRVTASFPIEEYHIRPSVMATQGMSESRKKMICTVFEAHTPKGLDRAISWLCRQITDLEECPLHYQPSSKAQEKNAESQYPERSRFLEDTYALLQFLVEDQFNSKDQEKGAGELATVEKPKKAHGVDNAEEMEAGRMSAKRQEVEAALDAKIAAAARTRAISDLLFGPSPVRSWHKERAERVASRGAAAVAATRTRARSELQMGPTHVRQWRKEEAARFAVHDSLGAVQGTPQSNSQPASEAQGDGDVGDPNQQPSTPVRVAADQASTPSTSYSPDYASYPAFGGTRSPVTSPGYSPRTPSDEGDEW